MFFGCKTPKIFSPAAGNNNKLPFCCDSSLHFDKLIFFAKKIEDVIFIFLLRSKELVLKRSKMRFMFGGAGRRPEKIGVLGENYENAPPPC